MINDKGFLSAIIAEPDDNTHRLVYADWLDEHGEEERAEFIRAQCYKNDLSYRLQYRIDKHGWQSLIGRCKWIDDLILQYRNKNNSYPGYSWGSSESPTGPGLYKCGAAEIWVEYHSVIKLIFRRGFISEITCNLENWIGTLCEICNGGLIAGKFDTFNSQCPCGIGRINANGTLLVTCQPVERVNISNRKPMIYDSFKKFSNDFVWWFSSIIEENERPTRRLNNLPEFIWNFLPNGEVVNHWKHYNGIIEAETALSIALLSWAKTVKSPTNS